MRFSYTLFTRAYTFFSVLFFIFGALAILIGGKPLIATQAWNELSVSSAVTIFRLAVVVVFGAGFVISAFILVITQHRGFTAYKRIIDRLSNARSPQFNLNISFPEQDELGDLGRYLNRFVGELREFDRIKVEKMRAAQQQVSFLAEALEKGVLLVSRENKISYANSYFKELFKTGEKTIVGLPIGSVIQNDKIMESLDELHERPKNKVLEDLRIKSGDVVYKTRTTMIPIISSEVRLVSTLVIFDYVQKKMLQL